MSTSGHGEHTTQCPSFSNVPFETLDSSVAYFVNAALNVPMFLAATVANLVVLLAMRHVTSIRLPSKLLLCSLVLTDLGAGSVVAPQFVASLSSFGRLIPNLCHVRFTFHSFTQVPCSPVLRLWLWYWSAWTDTPLCSYTSTINRGPQPRAFVQCSRSCGLIPCCFSGTVKFLIQSPLQAH